MEGQMTKHTDQVETILSGFLPWVETQSGEYEYDDCSGCALATYLRAVGYKRARVGGTHFSFARGISVPAHYLPWHIADGLSTLPHTYEGLAERLRAA
jgi:hypothetical protein